MNLPIEGKNVLLIDDICDTGETLFEVKKYCEKFNPNRLKTAVLFLRDDKEHQIEPDFYVKSTHEWTISPWELRDLE